VPLKHTQAWRVSDLEHVVAASELARLTAGVGRDLPDVVEEVMSVHHVGAEGAEVGNGGRLPLR
jgi:hypothetical protein